MVTLHVTRTRRKISNQNLNIMKHLSNISLQACICLYLGYVIMKKETGRRKLSQSNLRMLQFGVV